MGRTARRIEVVGEEGTKLHAEQTTLGKNGTMGFLQGEEALQQMRVCADNSLAEECSHLRTTDIEDVAETGQAVPLQIAMRRR